MNKKGFTLIELLMVISIIGLLSSVVIGSTVEARIKALNAKASEIARQYKIAIEIYRTSNGSYPKPSPATFGASFPYPLNSSDSSADLQLNSILSTLVSGLPTLDFLPHSSASLKSVYYTCGLPQFSINQNDPCVDYAITWYLKGNVKCSNGSYISQYISTSDATFCRYRTRSDI